VLTAVVRRKEMDLVLRTTGVRFRGKKKQTKKKREERVEKKCGKVVVTAVT
jgi:hypothetical protein